MKFGVFLIILGALMMGGIIAYQIYQSATMTCVQYQMEYQPPSYVKIGNVLTPVGGGMEKTCTQWVKKGSKR